MSKLSEIPGTTPKEKGLGLPEPEPKRLKQGGRRPVRKAIANSMHSPSTQGQMGDSSESGQEVASVGFQKRAHGDDDLAMHSQQESEIDAAQNQQLAQQNEQILLMTRRNDKVETQLAVVENNLSSAVQTANNQFQIQRQQIENQAVVSAQNRELDQLRNELQEVKRTTQLTLTAPEPTLLLPAPPTSAPTPTPTAPTLPPPLTTAAMESETGVNSEAQEKIEEQNLKISKLEKMLEEQVAQANKIKWAKEAAAVDLALRSKLSDAQIAKSELQSQIKETALKQSRLDKDLEDKVRAEEQQKNMEMEGSGGERVKQLQRELDDSKLLHAENYETQADLLRQETAKLEKLLSEASEKEAQELMDKKLATMKDAMEMSVGLGGISFGEFQDRARLAELPEFTKMKSRYDDLVEQVKRTDIKDDERKKLEREKDLIENSPILNELRESNKKLMESESNSSRVSEKAESATERSLLKAGINPEGGMVGRGASGMSGAQGRADSGPSLPETMKFFQVIHEMMLEDFKVAQDLEKKSLEESRTITDHAIKSSKN